MRYDTATEVVTIGTKPARTIRVHERMDGWAILWACAKASPFLPATFHGRNQLVSNRSLADAHALLWACARQRPFLPAHCERDEGELLINEGLRGRPLPGPGQYAHFRERVGYWEAALELDDPESQLGSAVIAALNGYQTLMMENPLAGEPERFSSIVAETARDWAGECQGTTSYEV